MISPTGLSIESQVKYNINKCKASLTKLRSIGIFRGKLKKELLLSVFRSRIIPILEYGPNWHPLVPDLVKLIDIYVRSEVRYLGSSPRFVPNEDLMTYYQFESFSFRWNDLHSRFINNRAYKEKRKDKVVAQSKSKWIFKVNKPLQALENHDKESIYENMFLRVFNPSINSAIPCEVKDHGPKPDHHSQVNQYFQCYLKPLQQFDITPITTVKSKTDIPYPTNSITNFVLNERNLGNKDVLIYSDASYNHVNGQSNGAYLAIDNNYYIEERGIKFVNINIDSSTQL